MSKVSYKYHAHESPEPFQDKVSEVERDKSKRKMLERLFSIKEPEEIWQFLDRHKKLYDTLIEVFENVKTFFNHILVDIELEYDEDPEEDYELLSVIVKTNASPRQSLDVLYKFDYDWWLDVDREISAFLNVMVRPV